MTTELVESLWLPSPANEWHPRVTVSQCLIKPRKEKALVRGVEGVGAVVVLTKIDVGKHENRSACQSLYHNQAS